MDNHFFGEWVYFENDEEKEDAYKYLALWKKFMLKRLRNMEQVGHDQIVLRNNIEDFNRKIIPTMTLGIKIEMKGKLPENCHTLEELQTILS